MRERGISAAVKLLNPGEQLFLYESPPVTAPDPVRQRASAAKSDCLFGKLVSSW